MSKPRFKYVIIKHPSDYAVHEAYHDNGKIVAVSGEPVTLYGYSSKELKDIANLLVKDLENAIAIDGDCEDLYEAYDNMSFVELPKAEILPLKRP